MPLCHMFYLLTPNYECPATESRERPDIINVLLEKYPCHNQRDWQISRGGGMASGGIAGSSFVCTKLGEGIDVRITKPLNL